MVENDYRFRGENSCNIVSIPFLIREKCVAAINVERESSGKTKKFGEILITEPFQSGYYQKEENQFQII